MIKQRLLPVELQVAVVLLRDINGRTSDAQALGRFLEPLARGAWLGSGCRGKSRCVAWDVWRILEICGGISRNWWDFLGNSWDFWGNLEAQRDINTEFIGFLGFHAYILLVLVSQFA